MSPTVRCLETVVGPGRQGSALPSLGVATFRFTCSSCGEVHEGIPTFGAKAPLSYFAVPEAERAVRCSLGTDDCVIDEQHFLVRGCIELPVIGHDEPFVWGAWVSLSRENFAEWVRSYDEPHRSHLGPYFGWLDAWIKPYPETMNLKTMVHLRDHGIRPYIELEQTDHPLAVEQREGISPDRVAELYELMVHGASP